MDVEWLCSVSARTLRELSSSNLASVRLRTLVSIRAALAHNYRCIVSDGQIEGAAKKVVVGKVDCVSDATRATRWLERLKYLKSTNSRVIIDYTDHHLSVDTPAAHFYRAALPLADIVVTSSQKLCAHILEFTRRDAVMISDPIEVDVQQPRIHTGSPISLLWFGHASNLPYLIDYLRYRYRSRHQRRLIVMTNLVPLPELYMEALKAPYLEALEIKVVRWSLEGMQAAAKLCDACIIPAGVNDPRKNGASSNRLLTALAMGLPVAADSLDSYRSFDTFFSDLQTVNLDELLNQQEASASTILDAQKLILRDHTIDAAKRRWASLLSQ